MMENSINKFIFSFCVVIIILANSDQTIGISYKEDLTLTLEQKTALETFRALMVDRLPQEYMKKETYLIKWLRSRDFNVKKAEEFLTNNLKWREEMKMDTIHQEDWSEWIRNYKYFIQGRDKQGRPILYYDLAGMDIRRAIIKAKSDKLLRYVDKVLDEGCGLVRELGEKYQNITRGNLLVNVKGFSLVEQGCLRCIPVLLRMVTSYEDHFPECADKIIFLNVPVIALPIAEVARPLISSDTSRALQVFGTNRRNWHRALTKDFDLDQLPPQLGGTMQYTGLNDVKK